MLLLLIILAASLVSSAPFLGGRSNISVDRDPGRPQVTAISGAHKDPPFIKKDNANSLMRDFQAMSRVPLEGQMDEAALQRKQIWENAVKNDENRLYSDQVLPIKPDALKRTRCNAVPFTQNLFRKHCIPLQIPNKFCFGQCNSFYVPGWPSALPQPCSSCTPVVSKRVYLPLRCRGGQVSWEEVVLVEECGCEIHDDHLSQVGSGEGLPRY
ncbi:DAN domain family member 5-like [Eleutherodactylus coqui]|uniref:DAN domain family member 5-like n=1 Tax=Eleutherodactylus coqui TaxID=57060 RepID=UPI003462C840